MTKKDKVTVDDIIGIVKCEPTNSVEEVRKLRGRENMTEKRVKLHIKWYNIEKTEGEATLTDNGQPLIQTERITDARLLKNILNDLYNENEQLRKDATTLIYANQDYRHENEQLKSTVKEVLGLLSDEVDLFSDKATEHDINAYVELKELDNKDAYYMATATKKAIRMLKELQE